VRGHRGQEHATVVLLPGLGADHRLFRWQSDAVPELVVPPWPDVKPDDTLASFAARLVDPDPWLRVFKPEAAVALSLFEGLVRSPLLLSAVAEAAGGNALTQLGRLLPEILAARRSGRSLAASGEPG
jgi:hypothetical protein